MTLHDEIFEQPAVLSRLLAEGWGPITKAAATIRARGVRHVYLAARGTSEHAGIYGQYILGMFNGLSVALAAPSLFTVYGRPPRLADGLVIGISQSGQSPDIVAVVEEGRRQGALTLAISNDPGSPLARAAELTLAIGAGPERAVAATKTYSATLLILAMLSAALDEHGADRRAAIAGVPGALAEALAAEAQVAELARRFKAIDRCVILGRGLNHATALEWALKLKELTYVVADPYSTAAFLHGPIALVEAGFPVFALAPSGAVAEESLELAGRLAAEQGAAVVALTDRAAPAGVERVGLPAGLPEWLSPIAAIGPAQLFCYHLARARGLDTEAPRALHKVTLTR